MKKNYKIGVIGGDGIGPEIIREGVKVIDSVSEVCDFKIEWIYYDFGGERYLKTGETLPESAIEEFKKLDAIYLGAVGHPDVPPGILEKGILLKIRFELDQYINLRPVKLFPGVDCPLKNKTPEDIDYVVVRENTEGLYCGIGGNFKKGTKDEIAIQLSINTRKGVERCIRFAFELSRKRNKKKTLTVVDKANVLTYEGDLWRRTANEVSKDFSDIKLDFAFVDAICMWMVKNPEWFDVIVTNNMFGDIITDLGAITQGGLGIAAGGNINPEGVSMFEPIHGSAPKYAGKNIACPLATILAGSMMLEQLGEMKGAKIIEKAIIKALSEGYIKSLEAGKMGLTTSEVGDLIAKFVKEIKE
ncbi:MAG: 3-isopropylmalate dehydrogenase [Candidatus Omnitrophica bacterium]|nr:3-isopropylmalate dehydrogenase [Candidatus Omnitrophota bacterium]MCM8806779.1 3-isopropylmalate dehydrogenase [Candidatus Omnitrophota bacterium]